jgi:hypothetical protein
MISINPKFSRFLSGAVLTVVLGLSALPASAQTTSVGISDLQTDLTTAKSIVTNIAIPLAVAVGAFAIGYQFIKRAAYA